MRRGGNKNMKDGEGERRRNREGKSRYLCSLSDRAHIHQAALGLSPVPARDEVKQTSGKKFTDLALSCQLSLPVASVRPSRVPQIPRSQRGTVFPQLKLNSAGLGFPTL